MRGRAASPGPGARANARLLKRMREIHEDSKGVIGAPRMQEDLVNEGRAGQPESGGAVDGACGTARLAKAQEAPLRRQAWDTFRWGGEVAQRITSAAVL